ncbi:MAG: nucleotidyl transferase AbiEii/AbiGii toxin family protein [Fidelibacterota bacterium]
MSDYATYYEGILYPLQNGILDTVRKSGTPFFLTGGTALSRYYLSYRYSDDLDLFVNRDPHYSQHVTRLLQLWTADKTKVGYHVELN